VYTDDGYRFLMRTSGDYGKNLRSRDDLTILGRWIKGRMEINNSLRSGEILTMKNLKKYGRDTITLTKTKMSEKEEHSDTKLDVWYLDFKSLARSK